jgi:hypothetical protein
LVVHGFKLLFQLDDWKIKISKINSRSNLEILGFSQRIEATPKPKRSNAVTRLSRDSLLSLPILKPTEIANPLRD